MKLKDYWDIHYELTGTTSGILRTLVLSGVAAVWLFKRIEGDKVIIPPPAVWALLAFSTAVLFDLLQYTWSGYVYGQLARIAEKKNMKQEDDLPLHSPWYNTPTYVFYWGKLLLTLVGYGFLAKYLLGLIA